METPRRRLGIVLAAAGAALAAWRVWAMRSAEPEPAEDIDDVDLLPDALGSLPATRQPRRASVSASQGRRGDPVDRGSGTAVRLDLSRAQDSGLRPVVEFLTFLQETRGDSSHLLFVRYDDLDDLAEAEGVSSAEFLNRLDQLGVVVSTN